MTDPNRIRSTTGGAPPGNEAASLPSDSEPAARTADGLRSLEESEARFSATFEQAAVGMAHVALDGRWLRVNRQLCRILGYTHQELWQLTFQEITHPDDLAADLLLADRLHAGEIDHYSLQKRYLRKDGSPLWVNLTGSMVRRADGTPDYFIAVVEDIQARKEAEFRLVAAERHLRRVLDGLFAFVGVLSPDGTLLEANRAALDAAGLQPADVIGRPFEETFWWSYDAGVQQRLRAAIECAAAGEASRFDVVVRLGEANYEPIDFALAPLRDEEGRITHLIPSAFVITERVRAEEALKREQHQLKTITDNATLALFIMDEQQQCTFMNPAAELLTGYSLEEVRGRPLHDVVHHTRPDGSAFPMAECAIDRALPQNMQEQGEEVFVRPDGSFYPVAFTASPIREGERTVGTVLEVRDITEERNRQRERDALLAAERSARAEAELLARRLQLSEEQQRRIFASAATGMAVARPDGRFMEVNDAYCALLGYRAEELIGHAYHLDLIHPDDREHNMRLLERLVAGEFPSFVVENRYVRSDGQPVWVRKSVSLLRDASGQPEQVVAVVEDISDRVRAEAERRQRLTAAEAAREALRRSEERFRALADNIPQLVWMADASGAISWYNQRWYEYTGMVPGEAGGWARLHHAEHLARVTEGFRRAVEAGEPWEDTFPLRSSTGDYRWFLSRAVPIRDEAGNVSLWFGTNTDVTEQREAAAERERLYQEARAASEAKSKFLAVMSHELRTPLNAILGGNELLSLGIRGPVTPEQRVELERIASSAWHLVHIIDEILTFSRVDAGQERLRLEEVDVLSIARESVATLEAQALRQCIELRAEIPDGELRLASDAGKLRQVLLNLVGNAVKFTHAGSVVLRVEPRADDVLFQVRDTGPGIPPAEHERIFEPFTQVDDSHTRTSGGTGLGLAVARQLTRLLGGDIRLESTPGEGSLFTLSLPRS